VKYAWIAKAQGRVAGHAGLRGAGCEPQRIPRASASIEPSPAGPAAVALSDDALLVHIKAIHAETRGGYGWPRVWKELLAEASAWARSGCKSS
jgi:putative transposase